MIGDRISILITVRREDGEFDARIWVAYWVERDTIELEVTCFFWDTPTMKDGVS